MDSWVPDGYQLSTAPSIGMSHLVALNGNEAPPGTAEFQTSEIQEIGKIDKQPHPKGSHLREVSVQFKPIQPRTLTHIPAPIKISTRHRDDISENFAYTRTRTNKAPPKSHNPWGRRGTIACQPCRDRKIKV
jgi:hypothetical protein